MLFTAPPLEPQETDVLGRIDEIMRQLGHALQAPRVWSGLLRRVSLARNVQGSNSIEGFVVTIDDAIAAVERAEPLEASGVTWAAVQGYQDAMTYVLQLSDDPYFSFSADLIRGLHYTMMKYDLDRSPGRWRLGEILVVDESSGAVVYRGPEADLVVDLVDELAAALNVSDGQHPIVRAAMAHLNLVMIHPFRDGNGRMGRCLQTLVLARTGVLSPPFASIEEYLGRNTTDYYRVLAAVGGGTWRPSNSAQMWIRFCLTAHFRQASTLQLRFANIERLWDALAAESERLGLPARTLLALADAAMGYRVRNATYRPSSDISGNLASRDLKQLTDAGLLVARGEKRGRHYVASPRVLAVRDRVWVRQRVVDPWADGMTQAKPVAPPPR